MSGRHLTINQRRLRVVLEEPVATPDDIGGAAIVFVPRVTLWARLEPASMSDRAEAERAEGFVTHRLTLRWRGDITGAMRFAAGGRRFAVRGQADPDGRRRNLIVIVEEVQP